MSKRFFQAVGIALLIATVGIVSCQAMFTHTTGLGATQATSKLLGR
jgi:hypothetical protein